MVNIQVKAVNENPAQAIEQEVEVSVTPLYIAALAKEKFASFASLPVNCLQVYLESGAEFTDKMKLQDGQKLYVAQKIESEDADPIIRLCILGPGSVGKSALTMRFTNDIFHEDYDPTIEDAYRKQVWFDGKLATLDILDTAGQEDYKPLRAAWYRDKDGFILIFDLTSETSLEALSKFRDEITDFYSDYYDKRKTPPIVLVGNKADLLSPSEAEVILDKAAQKVSEWGVTDILRTSAKTNLNVDAAFANIVRATRRSRNEQQKPDEERTCCVVL